MLKLGIMVLILLSIWIQHNYHINNVKVLKGVAEVASREIRLAHKYHGILYSTDTSGYHTFSRGGKTYNLFDKKYFPKLFKIIRRKK